MNCDTALWMMNEVYVTYTYSSGTWSPSEPVVSIGEIVLEQQKRRVLVAPEFPGLAVNGSGGFSEIMETCRSALKAGRQLAKR